MCRLPFISISTSPPRASATAAAAEAWLCSVGDEPEARDVGAVRLGHGPDARRRPDQHRHDQLAARRLERAEQRIAVAGMRDRAAHRLERLALACSRLREHVVAPQDDLGRGDVGVGEPPARRLDHRRAPEHAALADARIAVEHRRSPVSGVLLAHGDRTPRARRRPAHCRRTRAASTRCACPGPAACARAFPRSPRSTPTASTQSSSPVGLAQRPRRETARCRPRPAPAPRSRSASAHVARSPRRPTSISSKVTLR